MCKYNRVYKDNMVTLMNEGFLDFDQNIKVLQCNSNRVDLAISQLIDLMDWADFEWNELGYTWE